MKGIQVKLAVDFHDHHILAFVLSLVRQTVQGQLLLYAVPEMAVSLVELEIKVNNAAIAANTIQAKTYDLELSEFERGLIVKACELYIFDTGPQVLFDSARDIKAAKKFLAKIKSL